MSVSTWRVIGSSNFDNESVNDFVQAEGLTRAEAEEQANLLNNREGMYSHYIYTAQPLSYQLYKFEP